MDLFGEPDPARSFLERTTEQVIVWCEAADVDVGNGYQVGRRGAYVGFVSRVYDWGIVVTSRLGDWRWATRWDLIRWAAPRRTQP